jgi:hypothetical protein
MAREGWGTSGINRYTATAIPFYIPFLGIARPQPQFPHSCVLERFIYSQDQSTYVFPPAEQADPSWEYEYIIRSKTHECGNGLRPRYSFSGNICFIFSAFCLCSVGL